ncbi:hypothetical protein BV22DRAFT_99215 [Leucogyrophana mollusca]|uniref:Uncharacterized protein n=1 Tax=Leucogyrophana mollusca TaxID=85980 RepID=A0ACB8BVU2_9AGAM|nr:hypothetical protein BV22DRAFT_99215 [Leucogyrophana mollusca]
MGSQSSSSAAPTSVVSQLLNDPPSIIPVLSYHLMRGSVTNTSIATSPEHSIVHTALTDPSMVLLENNGSQVLVLTKESDGFVHILNQPTDVVLTRQDDISILDDTYAWSIINQMLVVPLKMSETLPNHNLNTFLQSVAIAGIQEPLENIPGVTLFVPQDSAFSSAQSILSHLDNTELASVLRGHVSYISQP